MTLDEKLTELKAKAEAATPSPWRAGRMDMRSYDAATGEQHKNIYGPNYEPKLHLGHRVPVEVARAVGDSSLEDAAFIGAAHPAVVLALIEVAEAGADICLHALTERRLRSALASLDAALGDELKGVSGG